VRPAAEYFGEIADVRVPAEMLKLAEHILETKVAEFDPSKFEDHYETALIEMLKTKQAGAVFKKAAPASEPARVINLMDALRRSIAEGKTTKALPRAKRKRAEAKHEEMRKAPQFKLPIAGGKSKQAAPAAAAPKRAPSARKRA
jgi:DNA end-binding protein Ku